MDAEFSVYVDGIAPEFRPLFERLHGIVMATRPEGELGMAYGMPTYRAGKRRLNIGVWQHGISVYGWRRDNDGGFSARHPDLLSSKSTIRIRPNDAADISDEEFAGLLGGALEP
jgi:uncharacterized protein YdhG (YjbR/CyaY superfamily)